MLTYACICVSHFVLLHMHLSRPNSLPFSAALGRNLAADWMQDGAVLDEKRSTQCVETPRFFTPSVNATIILMPARRKDKLLVRGQRAYLCPEKSSPDAHQTLNSRSALPTMLISHTTGAFEQFWRNDSAPSYTLIGP